MAFWRQSFIAFSSDPEVREMLESEIPAWIFAPDGSRVLWSNPAGGRALGSARFSDLATRRWAADHPLRRDVESLARSAARGPAVARLRLLRTAGAFPIICRSRLVSAASGERGLMLVATDRSAGSPDSPSLMDFLAEPGEVREMAQAAATGEGWPAAFAPGQDGADLAATLRRHLATTFSALRQAGTIGDSAGADRTGGSKGWTEAGIWAARAMPRPRPAPVEAPAAKSETARAPAPHPVQGTPRPRTTTSAVSDAPGAGWEEIEPKLRIMAGRVGAELDRKPVRFLFQTDAADRFLFVSPGLGQVVGRNAEVIGESWTDVAQRLRLDPRDRIAQAFAQRDTWSGQFAWWPVEGSDVRVPVELTALPVFAMDHSFQGYRGFGILRPAEALMPAAFETRFGNAKDLRQAPQVPPYEEAATQTPDNVVPIRADVDALVDIGNLSAQEKSAFEEIAAALQDRIAAGSPADAAHRGGETKPETLAEPVHADKTSAETPRSEPTTAAPPQPAAAPPPTDSPRGEGAAAAPRDEDGSTPRRGGYVPGVLKRQASPEAAEEPAPAPQPAAPEPKRPTPEFKPAAPEKTPPKRSAEDDLRRRLREMTAILDTATDGVIVLDGEGRIESVNASARALFSMDEAALRDMQFRDLLAPESRQLADDYLSGLKDNGVASLLNEGRELEGLTSAGTLPLFVTIGRIGGKDGGRYCAVLRDITHWKRTEAELVAARRAAEEASSQKSDFLARVSHEIRTPLNAIIGFAEVMIEERFGPVASERYRDYLRDIRTSGEHVVSLVNDLLDISKIEAGKLDLDFVAVPLNDLVRECMALMQQQAGRAQVVLRSSLPREVPGVVADQRTMRQIVLNLLSNSVKYTGPGGQVIVSTTLAETGEAVLRVRDTGEGMTEEELARALEPFRQIATSAIGDRSGSTGLGLPLTKALVEANRATFAIRSAPGDGTVASVTFPPTRVLSE